MSKSISDLRDHLFETIAALRDETKPMDVDRARAISEVAKQMIDSAKVEVDYLRIAGGGESTFIDTAVEADNLPAGIVGITRHRLAR